MKQRKHQPTNTKTPSDAQDANELQFGVEVLESRDAPRTLPGGGLGRSVRILEGMIPPRGFNAS